jgi:two-component system sensor histidine kinase RegB
MISTAPALGPARGDTPRAVTMQDQPVAVRRMRSATLIMLRGLFILAQVLILVVAWRVLDWPFPVRTCLGLIAGSVAVNMAIALTPAARREARPWEVTLQLAFDILQLTALLYLIGGVLNPFAILLIFPISVGGNALPPRHAIGLCVLAVVAAIMLSLLAHTPQGGAASGALGFGGYRVGRSMALIVGLVFTTAYASWSSAQSARRELALNITESVLAREQRLSALGALSAAIAHELGTPLATIAIIATEMAREAPEGPLRDDARLMVDQAKRCREILKRLAEQPERQDALHERMSLLQFVRELVDPYSDATEVRVEALVTGPPGVPAPDLWRRPEILHAISTLIENAFDFARGEILLTARFDTEWVSVEVRDDGPGFTPDILARLGEPYLTSRPEGEGSRSGHIGMGLGVFIAKTLLERSGAAVHFGNAAPGGAVITARWPRSRIAAPPTEF